MAGSTSSLVSSCDPCAAGSTIFITGYGYPPNLTGQMRSAVYFSIYCDDGYEQTGNNLRRPTDANGMTTTTFVVPKGVTGDCYVLSMTPNSSGHWKFTDQATLEIGIY